MTGDRGASRSASLLEATPEVSVVPAPPSGSEVSVTPHAAASSDVPPSEASKVDDIGSPRGFRGASNASSIHA